MQYPDELEMIYKCFSGYEDPKEGTKSNILNDIVDCFNTNRRLNAFYPNNRSIDNIAKCAYEHAFDIDQDFIQSVYNKTALAYVNLKYSDFDPFNYFLNQIDQIYNNIDDQLPPSFYEAIERNAIKKTVNNITS